MDKKTRQLINKAKRPSKTEVKSFKALLFDDLTFNKNHQYQFLLYYLKNYLIVLSRRINREQHKISPNQKNNPPNLKVRRLVLKDKLEFADNMEKNVKNLAFLLSRESRYDAFFTRTLMALDKQSLLNYLEFQKNILIRIGHKGGISLNKIFKLDLCYFNIAIFIPASVLNI